MKPNIVFMGTPSFAVPSLNILLDHGYPVQAVFTQPDKPKGRGNKLSAPPVKELALEKAIPVFQPSRLRDGEALSILKGFAPDLVVVVAYGRILPADILELPPMGCINVHGSLLPALRGAAPIQRAIINGEEETGISIMYLAGEMDAGDIILQEKTAIGQDETSGELFERLSLCGAQCLLKAVQQLENGTAARIPQNHAAATHAAMIDKKMAELDFNLPPKQAKDLVRGLNPSPFAFTYFEGKRVKLHAIEVEPGTKGKPGEVLDAARLVVGCGGGAVRLVTLQPEGKSPMSGAAFANGKRLKGGEMFGKQQP